MLFRDFRPRAARLPSAWRHAAAVVITALALTGCSTAGLASPGSQATPSIGAPAGSSLVVTPRGSSLTVLDHAGGSVLDRLPGRTAMGSPLTLLVLQTRSDWVQVSLPGRPNGHAGWVRQGDVHLALTPWRLVVREKTHQLDVLKSGQRIAHYPVGVGKAATPTVRGTFFITDLIRPAQADGVYGPYAFGLSAYSEVLTSFAGGQGQIGLHGTNEPQLVGTDVSHGCLRVTNDVITTLARTIPLGTPVEIRA